MPTPVEEASFAELVVRFGRLTDNWSGSLTNLQNLVSLITMAGGRWWLDKALLDLDLVPDPGTPAVVYGDATPANNGIYVKTGISGAGPWEHTGFLFGSTISLAMLDPAVFESLRADVIQVIGRSGDPIEGAPVSDAMYIQAEPVAHYGQLSKLKVDLVDVGDLVIGRYEVSSNQTQIRRVQTATITVTDLGDGHKEFSPTDFGLMNFNAGDLIGLAGDGMFTASASLPVDGPGWRQINAALDDWRAMPALQTTIRLEYGAEFAQHPQVVNGPDFLAVQTLAADLANRTALLEDQADQQWANVVQTIGNPGALVTGAGVSGGMYIWADPCEHTGPLLTLDVFCVAPGTLQLAKWSIESDGKLHRNLLIDLPVTTAGEANFTPAHFGNIVVAQGEYLGIHAEGIMAATSATADGAGWWDVNAFATPRDVPAANVGNRLQARFRIQQQYFAPTAAAILDLQGRVAEIEADMESVVGTPLFAGAVLGSPESLDPTVLDRKAPLVGGKIEMIVPRSKGKRCIAHLATKADVYNGGAGITGLADVADAQSPYGSTALQLTTTGSGPLQYIPCAAATSYPINANGMILQFMFRSVSNVAANMDRFSIQLFSGGSPSLAAPGVGTVPSNYHELPVGDATSWFKGLLTSSNGLGRWQPGAVALSAFSAVSGGANLSGLTWGRYVVRATNGATMSLRFGSLNLVKNPLTKGVAIIDFDDGYLTQYTVSAPELVKRGFRGMFHPSPIALSIGVSSSTYMTHQHLIQAHDVLEFQIASQAWDTETAAIVDAMSHNERIGWFGKLRNWQKSLGLGYGTGHGSWFSGVGPADLAVFESFRTHFRSVRAFLGGNSDVSKPPFVYGETLPWSDPYMIRALNGASYTGTNNGDRLIQHAQQAIDHKGVAWIAYHQETGVGGNVQDGYRQYLDFLLLKSANGEIDVRTEEDLAFLMAA
ncbi:hypothetical protein [Caulobacter sp. Root1472]|uniref:hypothetical protein n=1 Tax=Caulobacter sp. Root1472 TaxID=1736470 RepID=UPI0006F54825|nr:hypothetical protein [Caulobacter sp. Root1472]KQZ31733.1 hypothetical protein ASD47_15795 [Caulobacter sp. Root1472]